MELLDFDQIDIGLAKVAAVQQLGIILTKKTEHYIVDMRLINGRWGCFVPGKGWRQASELLSDMRPKGG